MNNKSRGLQIVLFIIIITTIGFIFSRSMDSSEQSKHDSERVTEIVTPAIEPVVGEGNVTDNLVRKLAHVFEYMLLGGELAILFLIRNKRKPKHLYHILTFSMIIALSDETIQIFSNRGPQIKDVWIDLLGATIGLSVVILIYAASRLVISLINNSKTASK